MRKTVILAGLLLVMAHAVFAEQRGVLMDFHLKGNPGKNTEVNRSSMRLSIEVVYDSDTHKIEVTGDESVEAEVFLYKADGTIEDHSSTLNADFTVSFPGTYIIRIQGNGWYAEGEIEV